LTTQLKSQPYLSINNISTWLTLFTLINIAIASIIALRYYQVHSVPSTMLGYIFAITYIVGQIGLLSFILVCPLYLLAKIKSYSKLVKFLAISLGCIGLSLLLADTFIYQQYRFHINAMVVELFIAGGSEVISFSLTMWIIIIAAACTVIFLQQLIANYIDKKFSTLSKVPHYILLIVPLSLLISHLIHIVADSQYNKDITQQNHYLPLSQLTTAKTLMKKYGLLNVEAYKTQSLLLHKKQYSDLHYPLQPISQQTLQKPLNVIVIVIDSWRADMVDKQVTPNIYRFAQHSIQYLNHFSGSNNTRHGMFTLLYGITGNYWTDILQQQQGPVLIKSLLAQQYDINVFASAKLTMPEFDQTLFVDVKNLRTNSQGDLPWQRDVDLTNDYFIWQHNKASDNASFSLLFYDSAHGFSFPSDYETPFTPSLDTVNFLALNNNYDAEKFINRYKNALHFVDEQVGKVLTSLEDKLDETIVIITGDHGEEFNDSKKGYWGHNSNYSPYQTQVPLIIAWPQKKAKQVYQLTSHLDIAPTLMKEGLKVNNPSSDYSNGFSLFKPDYQRDYVVMGRNGYYAINNTKNIYELDRYGNFSIFTKEYCEDKDATLDIKLVQKAMAEMAYFYQKK
jgi:hypothetical protein